MNLYYSNLLENISYILIILENCKLPLEIHGINIIISGIIIFYLKKNIHQLYQIEIRSIKNKK